MQLQKVLLLRPHHINCIFFYRGFGYNKRFIKGMDKILDYLKNNQESKIKLVIKCDALCSNCPNNINNGFCITKEKVEELDYNTLNSYNLKENAEYKFVEVIDSIYKNFNQNKFIEICKACNWYKTGVCAENFIENQIAKWS